MSKDRTMENLAALLGTKDAYREGMREGERKGLLRAARLAKLLHTMHYSANYRTGVDIYAAFLRAEAKKLEVKRAE